MNTYEFKNDFIIGICDKNEKIKFIIDKDDYFKVSKYHWIINNKKNIGTYINKRFIPLARFVLNLPSTDTKRVLLKYPFDYRKKNLFHGNKYKFYKDYCEGECFDGTRFKIDIDDYELVQHYTWHLGNNYIVGKVNKKEIKLHRFLLSPKRDEEIDHINRDTFDNRRKNLRIVDRSTNCINRAIHSNNTSGCKGVYKIFNYDRYGVQINVDGKRKYLGSYDTFEEACLVRKKAEEKYHTGKYFEKDKIENQQPSLE